MDRVEFRARPAVMHEVHRQPSDRPPLVPNMQFAVPGERAQNTQFDLPVIRQSLQPRQPCRRHGHHHPLLGFGQPQFPRGKIRILDTDAVKVNFHPELFAHLADGGRESAGTAVRDRRVEPFVAGLAQQFHQSLFENGIANLHGTALCLPGVLGKIRGGKGGAVQAVQPGPAAERHHQIADLRARRVGAVWRDTDTTAVDQGIVHVAAVVDDGATQCGQPQFVPVVADPPHNPLPNPTRMEGSGGNLRVGQVRRTKAEDVGGGDRPGRNAKDIPHDTANAGVRATEGIQGGGVVVRFHLERQIQVVGEPNHPRIILKNRDEPLLGHFVVDRADAGVKDPVNGLCVDGPTLQILMAETDAGLEGLVLTVLGPGLGQRLQFHIRGITSEVPERLADGLHLVEAQRQTPIPAQGRQPHIRELAHRYGLAAA